MSQPRALLATIPPYSGGVPQMTRFIADTLKCAGIQPVLSYYEPYSLSPNLSVPGFQLLGKQIGCEKRKELNGYESFAIGAWLPELEFTHYLPTKIWRNLMESCDYYISISGNCLAGLPFTLKDKKFIAWVASSWAADREDRVNAFPWHRKILDKVVNTPVTRYMERKVLNKGKVLALSRYTRSSLNAVAGQNICNGILPMPIDSDTLNPSPARIQAGKIGFVGRIDDPRKNIELFVRTIARCRELNKDITSVVVGGEPSPSILNLVESLGLKNSVEFVRYVKHSKLVSLLQTLDVFVIPSHQEGLCIAALEAMACGCPVISTRCGGPEEFVHDGETGYLVDSDSNAMADKILEVVQDRELRNRLSANVRDLVLTNYSKASALDAFWKALNDTYH